MKNIILNSSQQFTISYILGKVKDCMVYDDNMDAMLDNGNIYLNLEKEEFQDLIDVLKQIND